MRLLNLIFFLGYIFGNCNGFYDFYWHPLNKTIPSWSTYKYNEEVHSSNIVRQYVLQESLPRSYLMCPKGFVIKKIEAELLQEQKNSSEIVKSEVNSFFNYNYFYDWWLHLFLECDPSWDFKIFYCHRTFSKWDKPSMQNIVRVLILSSKFFSHFHFLLSKLSKKIIGIFQACVFDFSNEFCLEDLLPGERKYLLVNLTCSNDREVERIFVGTPWIDLITRRKEFVLNVKYRYENSHLFFC